MIPARYIVHRFRIGRDKLLLFGYFIGWIVTGTVLLSLPAARRGNPLPVIDALFTATSAVCVTGLATVDTTSFTRFGQSVILLLIQAGGLGIITFATMYLFLPRTPVSVITRRFAGDYTVPGIEFRTRRLVGAILGSTILFELAGMIVAMPSVLRAGYGIFDALFHAVSAFCNAGFSTFRGGMQAFRDDVVMNFNTMILIVAGGLGFVVMQDLMKVIRKEKLHLAYHSSVVLRTTGFLLMAGWAGFLVTEWTHAYRSFPVPTRVLAALFQAVTPRTAGFDTVAQASLSSAGQLLTMFLMLIGASPASTGGGIKTTTFYLVMMVAFRFREGRDFVRDHGRKIAPSAIYKAMAIIIRAMMIISLGALTLLLAERSRGHMFNVEQAVFESISAFGTVGLSLGLTPSLGTVSKLALVAEMFIGRVGFFSMALPAVRDEIAAIDVPTAEVML